MAQCEAGIMRRWHRRDVNEPRGCRSDERDPPIGPYDPTRPGEDHDFDVITDDPDIDKAT